MSLENDLHAWTAPSSDTEKDKQDRTERMVLDAIEAHPAFDECKLRVFAKGSYANNTNVLLDSDVDVAVECTEVVYWGEAVEGAGDPGTPYKGIWTSTVLREGLVSALSSKFPKQVDTSGSTAIAVNSSSARVDADVVPCFSYIYYYRGGGSVTGTKIFPKSGAPIVNHPDQQLANGRDKNNRTDYAFKKTVRIMKRVSLEMVDEGVSPSLASYFVECLVYNCPDDLFTRSTWTDTVKACLFHIWDNLEGDEPSTEGERWMEVNGIFFLFHPGQEWTRRLGRGFANDAWNYLGFGE